MTLHSILREKGFHVHSIGPGALLDEVVQVLVRHNVGSLVVCEPASKGTDIHVIGIITERDVLRAQAAHRAPLEQITVATAMSTDLITAEISDELEDAMRLMTKHRVRHLPVMDEGRLCGIISIGDVMKANHEELALANCFMSKALLDA